MPKLTNEELQVIRERLKSFTVATRKEDEARKALERDADAAEKHHTLTNAEFEWEETKRYLEAYAADDIPALLAHIDELTAEKTYHFEDAEMWRAMVDGLHAELDLLMVPHDVPEGENLMRALSLLERFRSFFMVSQFGVPDSLMESYLRDRDNFDER